MQATANETLVAMRAEEGFRVYAPSDPGHTFTVSGTVSSPDCTCPEFQERIEEHPDFRCRHILAVESQLPKAPEEEEPPEQNEVPVRNSPNGQSHTGAQMLLKRSVSPDGKIDSLSVEFSCPVDGLTSEGILQRAGKALGLQDAIAATFLQERHGRAPENGRGNGKRNGGGNGYGSRTDGNGYTQARLLDIAGMQTRVGWRMFINVEANGQTLKLFGNRRELGEHLASAGYPELARNVNSGVELNVPCRVVIQPTDDGRYQNIAQILPAGNGTARGRAA